MTRSRFAIITHIMTFLAKFPEDWQPSSLIAQSIHINPVMVRKEVTLLKADGLIKSKEGKAGGLKLAKPASKILLSELLAVAKGNDHLLGFCTNEANGDCPIGRSMNKNLTKLYVDIEEKVEKELSKVTLEGFKDRF